MDIKLRIFGCDIIESVFNKKPVPPQQVYNDCYFDYRAPIEQPAPKQTSKSELMTKKVSQMDYNAICEVIGEKTGVAPEKVDQVLKLSGDFINNL